MYAREKGSKLWEAKGSKWLGKQTQKNLYSAEIYSGSRVH